MAVRVFYSRSWPKDKFNIFYLFEEIGGNRESLFLKNVKINVKILPF